MAVDFEVRDYVATVRINRPEAMNSIDTETRAQLVAAFQRVQNEDEIRVMVITGVGDRAFCTGADLKNSFPPKESYAELNFGRPHDESNQRMVTDKPVLCAINGYALGGGLELAMSCDIRIASDNARMGLPEARRATIPGSGGTQRLPRLIGLGNALHLLLTGDQIDAAEAYRLGLVCKVVPFAELAGAAFEMAQRIAANGPLAVRAIKRMVHQGLEMPLPAALQAERFLFGVMRDTEDRIEGRTAFKEKREPIYKGK